MSAPAVVTFDLLKRWLQHEVRVGDKHSPFPEAPGGEPSTPEEVAGQEAKLAEPEADEAIRIYATGPVQVVGYGRNGTGAEQRLYIRAGCDGSEAYVGWQHGKPGKILLQGMDPDDLGPKLAGLVPPCRAATLEPAIVAYDRDDAPVPGHEPQHKHVSSLMEGDIGRGLYYVGMVHARDIVADHFAEFLIIDRGEGRYLLRRRRASDGSRVLELMPGERSRIGRELNGHMHRILDAF